MNVTDRKTYGPRNGNIDRNRRNRFWAMSPNNLGFVSSNVTNSDDAVLLVAQEKSWYPQLLRWNRDNTQITKIAFVPR